MKNMFKHWCNILKILLLTFVISLSGMERDELLPPKKRRKTRRKLLCAESFLHILGEPDLTVEALTHYRGHGGDLDKRASMDKQLIHVAALNGLQDVLLFLIDNGVNINTVDAVGRTALQWAVLGGQEATVLFLLQQGADVSDRDVLAKTLLIGSATWNRDLNTLETLLGVRQSMHPISRTIPQPITFMYTVGHMPSILALLSYGARLPDFPNLIYEWIKTILFTEPTDVDVLPEISLDDSDYRLDPVTQFTLAAGQGSINWVDYICKEYRGELSEDAYRNALVSAASGGHFDIVKCIESYLVSDEELSVCVPRMLAEALATACAQRRLNVINYLLHERNMGRDRNLVSLSNAGRLLRRLVRQSSSENDVSDSRFREHQALLELLTQTQRSLVAFDHPDLTVRSASHRRLIRPLVHELPVLPRELLMIVLCFFIKSQLHQIQMGRRMD